MPNELPPLRRSSRRSRAEPDAALARAPGVEYRYALTLSNPGDARGIFQLVAELGAAVRYLLIVQDGVEGRYRGYLGLDSSDIYELPLRMAARGIQIERGEQVKPEPPPGHVVGITSVRRR